MSSEDCMVSIPWRRMEELIQNETLLQAVRAALEENESDYADKKQLLAIVNATIA